MSVTQGLGLGIGPKYVWGKEKIEYVVKTILWRDCRHHKRDGLRVNQHLYFTNFKKRSVLFNTMVLAALVSNAPLIFFFLWKALDNITNDLLRQIWVLPQRYEFSFSAVQIFSPLFTFAIISDNAVLFLPLKSQERQSNYFLLQLTYRKE